MIGINMKKRSKKPKFKRTIITTDNNKFDTIHIKEILPKVAISKGIMNICELSVVDIELITEENNLDLNLVLRKEFILE